jgi:predicted RNA-binding Zn-ribbon protein involved in translation (DUF1610 family)
MSEVLGEAVRGPIEIRDGVVLNSCPECGSFLDAPRAHPSTGEVARKCASCRHWYPVQPAATAEA